MNRLSTRATLFPWIAAALVVSAVAHAQTLPAQPAPLPATATAPAEETPDPAVDAILNRLEKKGDLIDSIEADITFIKIDPVLDDRQEYNGLLRFKQVRPNPRFFIRFDSLKREGAVRESRQWHVFDGRWYIEARESTKTIVKNEIVRPGETVEVFKLGRGPFPLPFGQKKADPLRHVTVKLAAPAPDDPPNADHLECTPRPGTEMAGKYATVHFHVDRTLDLPVRVETTDQQEGNQIIARFTHVKVNPGLVESQLNLPELRDYAVDTNPIKEPDRADKEGE